jgi:Ran GTPase-activating protein (RanGAP) involved in mRNA processing and transport
LETLDLSYTQINTDGLLYLSGGLYFNRNLKYINLSGNSFESDGIEGLVSTLKDHKSIEKVDIGNNSKIDEKSINFLSEILKSKFTLSKLTLKRKIKE